MGQLKPAKKSGWNVQIVWTPLTDPFADATLAALKQRLRGRGKVSTISIRPAAYADVSQRVSRDRHHGPVAAQPVRRLALAPAPAVPLIAKAAASRMPTVSPSTLTPERVRGHLDQPSTAAAALEAIKSRAASWRCNAGTSTMLTAPGRPRWRSTSVKVAADRQQRFHRGRWPRPGPGILSRSQPVVLPRRHHGRRCVEPASRSARATSRWPTRHVAA